MLSDRLPETEIMVLLEQRFEQRFLPRTPHLMNLDPRLEFPEWLNYRPIIRHNRPRPQTLCHVIAHGAPHCGQLDLASAMEHQQQAPAQHVA